MHHNGEKMNDDEHLHITDWFRRVRESQLIHYACSEHFRNLNLLLGIPTIVLTTIVGTAVFISLGNQSVGNYKITIGMVSMLASVLAALHTFLGYAQRAEKHRLTATGYASIRRELELLKTFPIADSNELSKKLETIKLRMDHLTESSESVPHRIWKKHVSELKGTDHKRIFHLPKKLNVRR